MALLALPKPVRGQPILVRADSAGATHAFVNDLVGRGLEFSIGFAIDADVKAAILAAPQAPGSRQPTPPVASVPARGSVSSCGWTCRVGLRGPGRSAAASGPTLARRTR
jgi:hypothetical protein